MVNGPVELIQTLATFLANGVGCFLAFDIEESFGNACLLISERKSCSRPFCCDRDCILLVSCHVKILIGPFDWLFPTLGEKPCFFSSTSAFVFSLNLSRELQLIRLSLAFLGSLLGNCKRRNDHGRPLERQFDTCVEDSFSRW